MSGSDGVEKGWSGMEAQNNTVGRGLLQGGVLGFRMLPEVVIPTHEAWSFPGYIRTSLYARGLVGNTFTNSFQAEGQLAVYAPRPDSE